MRQCQQVVVFEIADPIRFFGAHGIVWAPSENGPRYNLSSEIENLYFLSSRHIIEQKGVNDTLALDLAGEELFLQPSVS
jgi:hypothetical protein